MRYLKPPSSAGDCRILIAGLCRSITAKRFGTSGNENCSGRPLNDADRIRYSDGCDARCDIQRGLRVPRPVEDNVSQHFLVRIGCSQFVDEV
jgi:hypothetical protein